jgi:hypothetical protein
MQVYMMMLQKYQFELRDCLHIFSCHKEAGISLAKKVLSPIANLGRWQGAPITKATGAGHITYTIATEIRVATSEHHHPTVATETGPACYWPNVAMESSKFSPTSLSEMKTDDVKNSYCPEITRVHLGRKDYTNSIKINWSGYNLILYCHSL